LKQIASNYDLNEDSLDSDSKENALYTVRYAEFGISSCNIGRNDSIDVGRHLVPFLRIYMPYLQTLRLWRPDDFPWTSSKFSF